MIAELNLGWSVHVIHEHALVNEFLREDALDDVDAHVVVLAPVEQPDDGILPELHGQAVLSVCAELESHLARPTLEVIPESSRQQDDVDGVSGGANQRFFEDAFGSVVIEVEVRLCVEIGVDLMDH